MAARTSAAIAGVRRWNGWGDEAIQAQVPPAMRAALAGALGAGRPPADVGLDQLLDRVPPGSLAPHPLIDDGPVTRVRHARGQSLPDLIALRGGIGLTFPDGVAFPDSAEDVRALLALALERGYALIPYGGGTSVVGHVNVAPSDRPVLTVDLSRLDGLLDLDEASGLARFGAGVAGRRLEAALRPYGCTLGHFPQSFEYSTLGGWIATRSRGQQAILYGGIEGLLAGATLESPVGPLTLPPIVASAAGPDLRQLLLGSEGRLGIITEATVRISRQPTGERFVGYLLPDLDRAVAAVREIAQARIAVSMLRLSDPIETQFNLATAGDPAQLDAADLILRAQGVGDGRCLLLVGLTELSPAMHVAEEADWVICGLGGARLPLLDYGASWAASRFATPYLRNSLWELGYAVDTVETAARWSDLDATRTAIEQALRQALEPCGESVLAFSHLSQVYPGGSSIYTTYAFRVADDPVETLERWRLLKSAASRAVVAHGATISHQHGVGQDHLPYLEVEKGPIGVGLIRAVAASLDPHGLLNPGKLVE